MERKFHKIPVADEYNGSNDRFDLDSLLHPAQAFEHPSRVVNDPDLTLNEKRAILASWASDACAIETCPSFRHLTGGEKPVPFDEVMEALRALDKEARQGDTAARYRRVLRRGRLLSKRSDSKGGNQGHGPILN